jgi:hypothetical protein
MKNIRWLGAIGVLLFCTALSAQDIRVTSTAQEVATNFSAGHPNGLSNGNCTLGEAILAVNRRRDVDACVVLSGSGDPLPFPVSGPVTITLTPGAVYTLMGQATTLYGPTGLPAIGAAIEGPFATAAPSEIIIDGHGAIIERSSAPGTPRFRLFAVAGPVKVSPTLIEQARETHPFLTEAPGDRLSAGSLTLKRVWLRGGHARGGSGLTGGLGAGGAVFSAGTLKLENCLLTDNLAQGGDGRVGFGGGGMGGSGHTVRGGGGGGFGGNGNFSSGGGTLVNSAINGGFAFVAAGFGGGGFGQATPGHGGFGGGGGAKAPDLANTGGGRGGFGGGHGAEPLSEPGVGGSYTSGFGAGQNSARSRFHRLPDNSTIADDGMGLGGAIFSSDGSLEVSQSVFNRNRSEFPGFGGSIFVRNGSLWLRQSSLLDANADGIVDTGAALFVVADDAAAAVRIENSVVLAEPVDSGIHLTLNHT